MTYVFGPMHLGSKPGSKRAKREREKMARLVADQVVGMLVDGMTVVEVTSRNVAEMIGAF